MRLAPLAVSLLGWAAFGAAAGPIYQWTDDAGQVHYGELPPPGTAATAQGHPQPGASLDAPAPPKPAPSAPAAKAAPAAAPAPLSKTARAEQCQRATARIAFLEEKTARRIMVRAADGSEARMTEEAFEAELSKARARSAEHCRP